MVGVSMDGLKPSIWEEGIWRGDDAGGPVADGLKPIRDRGSVVDPAHLQQAWEANQARWTG